MMHSPASYGTIAKYKDSNRNNTNKQKPLYSYCYSFSTSPFPPFIIPT